jgi:RES domain-containing protein
MIEPCQQHWGEAHLYHRAPRPSPTPPQILSGDFSKAHGGRFTPVNSFRMCYLSLDAPTALREAERIPAPYVHCLIEGQLSSVLDLTKARVLSALGLTVAHSLPRHGPWMWR